MDELKAEFDIDELTVNLPNEEEKSDFIIESLHNDMNIEQKNEVHIEEKKQSLPEKMIINNTNDDNTDFWQSLESYFVCNPYMNSYFYTMNLGYACEAKYSNNTIYNNYIDSIQFKKLPYIFTSKDFYEINQNFNIKDFSLQYSYKMHYGMVTNILDHWSVLSDECIRVQKNVYQTSIWKQYTKYKKTINKNKINFKIKIKPYDLLYSFVATLHGRHYYPGIIVYIECNTGIIIWPNEYNVNNDEVFYDPIPNMTEAIATKSLLPLKTKKKFHRFDALKTNSNTKLSNEFHRGIISFYPTKYCFPYYNDY